MSVAVSNAIRQQPAVASGSSVARRAKPEEVEGTPKAGAQADTGAKVTLSKAAIAAAQAANQEATETPAQTAAEAQHNDPQALRLLARQAATAKARY